MAASEHTGWVGARELAETTGAPVGAIERWLDLGLLPDAGTAVERIRLLAYAERRGVSAEDVAVASRTRGDLLAQYVEMIASGQLRVGHPLDETAAAIGLDPSLLRRLWAAAGLADQDEAYDEDVTALRGLRTALDAGFPEAAMAQLLRVFADALGRVADAEFRLFHYYVHDRLRAEGLTGRDLAEASETASRRVEELVEPAVLYFHRKAYQRSLREDFLLHVREDATPPGLVPGELQATILFVDVSGFTPLAEAMGDAAAALLMDRFSDLVRAAATRCDGRVVKQIGDEFMIVFGEPAAALGCGFDIHEAAVAEPQFPALRMGAHSGTVLYREGDYLGTTVNIAARVAAQAGRHHFLVTDALLPEARALAEVEVDSVGARALKGLPAEVDLYLVRRPHQRPHRVVDPVCHMELDPATSSAQLSRHGVEVHFCSDECLQRFASDPERYVPTPS